MDEGESNDRLVSVHLDGASIGRGTAAQEHERQAAVHDLLHANTFILPGRDAGPYRLELGLRDARLSFVVQSADKQPVVTHLLSLTPFRTLMRDYLLLCETHHEAAGKGRPEQLEAIDMGRRGLHNEAAELLGSRLQGKITADFDTMRRLFTLITALHWKR